MHNIVDIVANIDKRWMFFIVKFTKCETQQHIVSRCNEEDDQKKDDNKNIGG